ncbi:hypothetical protein H7H51_16415 [Mycolicibacterium farcinogenes]|nr:hypothetical protein [Mycolicibacterium farcinogenes]
MIRIAGAFVAITIAVTAVGCTREAPAPQPKAAEQADAKSGEVDVSALDPGNYPTKPLPPMGNGGDRQHVAVLEANRIAEVVVGPWEVDPAIIEPAGIGQAYSGLPILPEKLQMVLSEEAAEVAESIMITGYASRRQIQGQKVLLNVVFEMKDPEAAKSAARDMPQKMLDYAGQYDFTKATSVMPIPGHDGAFAVASTSTKYQQEGVTNRVTSFTARGPFVLMQSAETSGEMPEAVSLVAKTLDLQIPAIDAFNPTPPAELVNLPKDPTGLLARALPLAPKEENFDNNSTLGPRAMLSKEPKPIEAGDAFRDAGVDVKVFANSTVFRTRDNAAAKALAADYSKTEGGTVTAADAVPNLPDTACYKLTYELTGTEKFACTGAFDRYTFAVYGKRLKDAHQMAAAQYLILATK